jgi:hypothetical protein
LAILIPHASGFEEPTEIVALFLARQLRCHH